MHNALMLLGEESVSSTAKRGKREGRRPKDTAAKTGNKSRKAPAQKTAAEHRPGGPAKVQELICLSCAHCSTLTCIGISGPNYFGTPIC